jgi:hypothetical protein
MCMTAMTRLNFLCLFGCVKYRNIIFQSSPYTWCTYLLRLTSVHK